MDRSTLERLAIINQEALSSTPTLHNSYLRARAVIEAGVPGDLVECGIYAGSQCAAMALAVQELKSSRKVHCFDSFCGFPKASEKDDDEWRVRLGVGSAKEPSLPLDPAWGFNLKQTVGAAEKRFLRWGFPLSMFVFHEGWFENTVPVWQGAIALLRIDADLYESTRICLEYLYPLVSPGGTCIMDDYALGGCRKAFDEYFQDKIHPIEIDNGPVWWTKE